MSWVTVQKSLFTNLVIEISVAKDFEKFKGFTEVIHGITERAEARHVTIQLVIRTGIK